MLCVVPGKSGWGGSTLFPCTGRRGEFVAGISPELQGVYSETDADGIKRLYGYVLK
ncbi:hypothetical protein ACVXHA_05555 [Escherichia coli]